METIRFALRDSPVDVFTLFVSLYATLCEPDCVHTALRFDVDRTVAYGKPNGLQTILRFDDYRVAKTAWRAYDIAVSQ